MHESNACGLKTSISEADPREGPGGPRPRYFWTKLRPEGLKNIFSKNCPPSPYLRVWMTPSPPPPFPLSEGLDPPLDLAPESQIQTSCS